MTGEQFEDVIRSLRYRFGNNAINVECRLDNGDSTTFKVRMQEDVEENAKTQTMELVEYKNGKCRVIFVDLARIVSIQAELAAD